MIKTLGKSITGKLCLCTVLLVVATVLVSITYGSKSALAATCLLPFVALTCYTGNRKN
jgi:hypothetical protein